MANLTECWPDDGGRMSLHFLNAYAEELERVLPGHAITVEVSAVSDAFWRARQAASKAAEKFDHIFREMVRQHGGGLMDFELAAGGEWGPPGFALLVADDVEKVKAVVDGLEWMTHE